MRESGLVVDYFAAHHVGGLLGQGEALFGFTAFDRLKFGTAFFDGVGDKHRDPGQEGGTTDQHEADCVVGNKDHRDETNDPETHRDQITYLAAVQVT